MMNIKKLMFAILVAIGITLATNELSYSNVDRKTFCDGVYTLTRLCAYFGLFASDPCSGVLPVVRQALLNYGFTEEQSRNVGASCAFLCTSVREKMLNVVEFEKMTNKEYLKCLQSK